MSLAFYFAVATLEAMAQSGLSTGPQPLTSALGPAPVSLRLPAHAIVGSARLDAVNAKALSSASLRLSVGGRDVIARRTQEMHSNNGSHTWVGEVQGAPGGEISVTTGAAGTVYGVLHLGVDTWELRSTTVGRVVLYRINEELLPDELEPVRLNEPQEPAGSKATGGSTESAIEAGPVVQDILVVYTPAVVTELGGVSQVETQIQWAIDSANAAYIASNVNIRLNLVGTSLIEYHETGNISVALFRLQGMFDGFMDDVHALRNSLGADLVALLAQENDCGNALMPGAFSVTAPKCISGYTFTHEVGHNQGADHDRPTTLSTSTTAYNFGYRTCDHPDRAAGQAFRTLLSYGCVSTPPTPRVNYFSNPNVLYNGVAPMGISMAEDPAKSADNARVLNESAATTAAYRVAPVMLPAAPTALTGAVVSATQVNLTWTDNAADESGYYVERATVNEGIFAQVAQLAAGATSYAATGLTGNTGYYFRIRAFNGSGNSKYSNTVTLTTAAVPPPPAVPSPASIVVSTRSVTVRWTDVAGETGYEVVREQLKSGRWSVASTVSVGAGITSLAQSLNSGTYRYMIRARNASGLSASANAACTSQTGCNADGWAFVFTRR